MVNGTSGSFTGQINATSGSFTGTFKTPFKQLFDEYIFGGYMQKNDIDGYYFITPNIGVFDFKLPTGNEYNGVIVKMFMRDNSVNNKDILRLTVKTSNGKPIRGYMTGKLNSIDFNPGDYCELVNVGGYDWFLTYYYTATV